MTTTAIFYEYPLNIDYLIVDVRLRFGDLTGSQYSDTIIRTSIVAAIKYLQTRWLSKYLVYTESIELTPQPLDISAGYKVVSTINGNAVLPDNLTDGTIFRNPSITFNSIAPTIESIDEEVIILAAVYILRRAQVSSSATTFVSWSTEDIKYSNLGTERASAALLAADLAALNAYFGSRIGKPKKSLFPTAV